MAIEFKLLDYAGYESWNSFDVNIEDVALAWMEVWSGDEEITLITKTGERLFASEYHAFQPYFDDSYDIIKNGSWLVDKEVWDRRKNSYQDLYGDE